MIFRKHHNGVLLRCMESPDSERVLCDLHDGPAGGNFTSDNTMYKICKLIFIGLNFSRMLMLIPANV